MLRPCEQTIRDLQDELLETRLNIINMMPWEAYLSLSSYDSCKSRIETYQWPNAVASRLSELAKLLPPNIFGTSDRAYCPLCGAGSSRGYANGFAIPEGLRRHLVGWGDQECPVFAIAMRLARDAWHEKFHKQEEAEKRKMEARRRRETVYKTGPSQSPELIDKLSSWQRARRPDELAWAEKRLATLGFKIASDGSVKSYIDERDHFVVYADPRAKNRIGFSVYEKSVATGHNPPIISFSLLDSWKHDLPGKYQGRLPRVTEER